MATRRKQFLFTIDDYDIDLRHILGKGAFGIVYKGIHRVRKTQIAVKNVTYKEDGEEVNDYLVNMGNNELEIFRKLKDHANIVQLLHNHDDGESHWIFMEFCDLGDLPHYLKKATPSFAQKLKIFYECSSAIAFMHLFKPPMVHRDIKPQNVLMMMKANQHIAKITDFGMGKLLESSPAAVHNTLSTLAGTASYMAPEFYDGGYLKYKPSVDVFSLGLLFHVLLEYNGSNNGFIPQSIEAIKSNKVIYFGLEMSNAVKDLKLLPKLFADPPSSELPVHKVQHVIKDMIKYSDEDRITPLEVKDKIVDIYKFVLYPISGQADRLAKDHQYIEQLEVKNCEMRQLEARILQKDDQINRNEEDRVIQISNTNRVINEMQTELNDIKQSKKDLPHHMKGSQDKIQVLQGCTNQNDRDLKKMEETRRQLQIELDATNQSKADLQKQLLESQKYTQDLERQISVTEETNKNMVITSEKNRQGSTATNKQVPEIQGIKMAASHDMPQGKQINILLVGKTGHGKSATGNTILSELDDDLDDVFASDDSSVSVTAKVLKVTRLVRGRLITVVDTPGLCNTCNDDQFTLREIASAVQKCPEGYHAFVFVLRYPIRLDVEERRALEQFETLFGSDVFNYTITVFTHGHTFRRYQERKKKEGEKDLSFEEEIFKDEYSELGPVLRKFKGGVALFENSEKDPDVKNAMVSNLVRQIDALSMKNKGKCYGNRKMDPKILSCAIQ